MLFPAFLLFFVFLETSAACSCDETAVEELYCAADWVGIFKIKEKIVNGTSPEAVLKYKAGVVKMFKNSNISISNGFIVTLDTLASAGVCGLEWLEKKKMYFLSGKMDGKKFEMSMCNQVYVDEWKKVPQKIKRNLNTKAYDRCAKKSD